MENKSNKKVAIFLVILFLFAGLFWYGYKQITTFQDSQNKEIPTIAIDENKTDIITNDVAQAINTSDSVEPKNSNSSYSENFQMRGVSFGGSNIGLSSDSKLIPLKITDTRGEILATKGEKELKLVIFWNTSKPAMSEVTYQKDGAEARTIKEGSPGLIHALSVKVDTSARYTYAITVFDQWGNKSNSGTISVLTGGKTQSVFELITTQFKDIFKWAY
jgi:hypothetical protein